MNCSICWRCCVAGAFKSMASSAPCTNTPRPIARSRSKPPGSSSRGSASPANFDGLTRITGLAARASNLARTSAHTRRLSINSPTIRASLPFPASALLQHPATIPNPGVSTKALGDGIESARQQDRSVRLSPRTTESRAASFARVAATYSNRISSASSRLPCSSSASSNPAVRTAREIAIPIRRPRRNSNFAPVSEERPARSGQHDHGKFQALRLVHRQDAHDVVRLLAGR